MVLGDQPVFGDGPVHPIKRLFDNLFVKVSNALYLLLLL